MLVNLIVCFISLVLPYAAFAAEPNVEDSKSPDTRYLVRIISSQSSKNSSMIQFVDPQGSSEIIYRSENTDYPIATLSLNFRILWAPDSKHFAMMIRSEKLIWRTVIFSVNSGTTKQLTILDPTQFIEKNITDGKPFHLTRQAPIEWISPNRIKLLLVIDVAYSTENDNPRSHEVIVIWNVASDSFKLL